MAYAQVRLSLYDARAFNEDEYFYYDQPLNGDMHEVVKGKFIAFKGPVDRQPPSHPHPPARSHAPQVRAPASREGGGAGGLGEGGSQIVRQRSRDVRESTVTKQTRGYSGERGKRASERREKCARTQKHGRDSDREHCTRQLMAQTQV